ncbi:hypothetical protein I79_005643 [Cricetulus griseus]|uniref:Uncharacterized protein n=1 Tax=Cricetulus griseus TaxID=10029 RepID=G3H5Q7_CRIGR|nr:hypothetical protein I79_005643 [Cricetulus griseus]
MVLSMSRRKVQEPATPLASYMATALYLHIRILLISETCLSCCPIGHSVSFINK